MATYREIGAWVKREYGFTVKTCWIAHCKELCGLPRRDAPNRYGVWRVQPCPQNKEAANKAAFKHFGILDQ